MTPAEFAKKWGNVQLGESAASQSHFIDLCRLLGQPAPVEADPQGDWFTFEKGLDKSTGGKGFADVWRKDRFGWEYKGPDKDLSAAYQQLQLYREALGNPPLLVVCDLNTFEVHTNFTNTVKRVYQFTNDDLPLDRPVGDSGLTPLQVLRSLFEDPDRLNPGKLQSKLTEEAAELLRELADDMRTWNAKSKTPITEQEIAHFIMRMIFCFFASDVGLLDQEAFANLIKVNKTRPDDFREYTGELFAAMKDGGRFLMKDVPHFNGGLFDDTSVPELIADQIALLERLNELDWSDIEPSIFGTLFERIIDESKRRQLGLHYTSRDDIELIVEPVLMRPLREAWEREKTKAESYIDWQVQPESEQEFLKLRLEEILSRFLGRLATIRVLDPACGSGNFLYVSLALLKALEKEVIAFGERYGITGFIPGVHPRQLFGIEMNEYAQELASAVVWIGYLQWKHRNAFDLESETPILEPLDNIARMDAIVGRSDDGTLTEPDWPVADVIVGNPPFLGSQMLRSELKDNYVESLFEVWEGRVPHGADLCCYWFEKARSEIESGRAERAGLLATQGIRGGSNRDVLKRIKETGEIFWAQSDRVWTLDGAAVQVSMVGFDGGKEKSRELDGVSVSQIYANLRSGETDVTKARRLRGNLDIAFQGPVKVGKFDISASQAREMLRSPNPDGSSNRDVVQPWVNGRDIAARSRSRWIINFYQMPIEEASLYELPFEYVKKVVKPDRDKNNSRQRRTYWWRLGASGEELHNAMQPLDRYIVTPRVSKHRLFVWISADTLPDSAVVAIARDDDYFFGVLHSRAHELWARSQGTQLREVESGFRYTPTTTFETFPFPHPTAEQRAEIADAAERLDTLRQGWLNPAENTVSPSDLKRRTLTNLYNARPTWLHIAHKNLDDAVFAAYGWPPDLSDGEIIARLLALNLEREAV